MDEALLIALSKLKGETIQGSPNQTINVPMPSGIINSAYINIQDQTRDMGGNVQTAHLEISESYKLRRPRNLYIGQGERSKHGPIRPTIIPHK